MNSAIGPIRRFRQYTPFLRQLVKRDFTAKYKRSIIGIAWSVISPLFQMMIMVIVFTTYLGKGIEKFPVYIICGRLVFHFFSEATTLSQYSITGGVNYITKVSIPVYMLPLSKVISSLINTLVSLIALAIVMLATSAPPSLTTFLLPLPLIYTFFISLGVGMLLATTTVIFQDMIHLYNIITLALMYLTPIFYSESIYPAQYAGFFRINPLLHLVKMFRNVVYLNTLPTLQDNMICAGYSILFLALGSSVLRRNRNRLVLHI